MFTLILVTTIRLKKLIYVKLIKYLILGKGFTKGLHGYAELKYINLKRCFCVKTKNDSFSTVKWFCMGTRSNIFSVLFVFNVETVALN